MAFLAFNGSFAPADAVTVTLASDVLTASTKQMRYIVAAEAGVTDELKTITVDSTIPSGYSGIVILQADSGDTITIKDGTGNIVTGNNSDLVLAGDARLVLSYNGTNWVNISMVAQVTSFTVTNWTEDLTLDCDASSAAINADVLGTLIKAMIAMGAIDGSVSA